MDSNGTEQKSKSVVDDIINNVKRVITNPVEFYRTMSKAGGFGDPLVFAVVLGVVAGIIRAILGVFHFGFVGSTLMALASIIVTPVMIVIFGFVGAAIMFVIWKLLGSNENYETAYRCCAYMAAVSPITAILGVIPYVGSLIGLAWGLYLIVTASVEVHKIVAKTAWLVFGIITAIFALMAIGSQVAARRVSRGFQEMGAQNEEWAAQMSKAAAESGKASAAMAKALEAQARQAQAEAEKATREAEKESSQPTE